MKMKTRFCWALLVILGQAVFVSAAGGPAFSNLLPRVEKKADALVFSIDTAGTGEDFYFYYRIPGLRDFQVRKMKLDQAGRVYYQLATRNLYGRELEYFIRQKGLKSVAAISPVFTVTQITDGDSPAIYFQDPVMPADTAEPKPKNPFVLVDGSGSAATRLYDNAEPPGQKQTGTGNLRIYRNVSDEKDDSEFDFDSTVTYLSQITEVESHVNLTSMKLKFRKGRHKIEIGDLALSNSDFSTAYLNRRGLLYEMDGKALYLGTFYINSQQKTGFDGFGIPTDKSNIFGATAGFNLGKAFNPILKVRTMFLTGKDNLDSKNLFSTEDMFREGSLVNAWAEVLLFKNALNLKGEYAQSNFGKGADQEGIDKEKDEAFRGEITLNSGILSAKAGYTKVGSQFNSIGNLFLLNDWEGLTGNLGLNYRSFSLTVAYIDQNTCLLNNLVQPKLHSKNLNSEFSWLIANHLRIGAIFGFNNLDYDESTGLQTGGSDMDTRTYSANIGFISGFNAITFKVGKSESKNFTSNIDGAVTLNLKFGNFLTLNPTLSYQQNENLADASTSKIYNLYLNSELSFIPQVFTLTVSGAYAKTDNSVTDDFTSLSADANLNFFMAGLFKQKIQPVLSLRIRYMENKYGGTSTDSLAAYLQVDISF